MKSLVEILHSSHLNAAKKVCLHCSDGTAWTYEELYTYSRKIAGLIKSEGIKKNTNIGIYFNNNIHFVASLFGVLLADCIAVPIPYFSKEDEFKAISNSANLKICLVSMEEKMLPNVKNYHISFNSLREISTENIFVYHKKDSVAVMFPTSGSTGNPKIVMLSHSNIILNAMAHGKVLNLSNKDNFLISMPLYFSSAVTTQLIACLYFGTTITLNSLPFYPLNLLKSINKHNINTLALAPASLSMVVNQMARSGEKNHNINTIVVSGSPLEQETYKTSQIMFPEADILQTYGLTEGSPRVTMMRRGDVSLSCGSPVEDVEIKIIRENGVPCVKNEIGELIFKGPNVMKGYYRNNRLTRMVLKNGWLHSGDLGLLDSDGNLNIVGRIKNTIIVGGVNVYPEEIEEILLNLNEIKDVAITASPNKFYGEVPVALIVFQEGLLLQKKVLHSILASKLSQHKIPELWYGVNGIPRTTTGKIKRQSLLDIIKDMEYKEIT